jgi:hypothetical protein
VFESHTLNRDIWSNIQIQSFIRDNFLFLQLQRDSSDASRFSSFYRVQNVPYIGIIDPRTRQNIWHWQSSGTTNTLSVDDLLRQWRHLLTLNSFKHNGPPATSVSNPSIIPRKPMTEEEELEAAIKASLEDDSDFIIDDEEDENISILSFKTNGKSIIHLDEENENNQIEVDTSPSPNNNKTEASVAYPLSEEPPVGPDVTRIVVRLPEGQRTQRRFAKTDIIGSVLTYAVSLLPTTDRNIEAYRLVTTHPRRELNDCLLTLETASLLNAALILEPV